jgi:hypothetical protein
LKRATCLLAIAALLALAGCAQPARKQAYDAELGSHIRTVLLAQAPNQERFIVERDWFIPPGGLGAVFLLAAMADMGISTERVTAALDPGQTRLQDRFSEMLRDGLNAQGYETRIAVLPMAVEPDDLLPALRQHGAADAALVVTLKGCVGWPRTAGTPAQDPPPMDFFPLLTVTAKALDLGSGAVLYEDRFVYGRADLHEGGVYFPVDPKYGFASVGELVAEPTRLREGWWAGMRVIADKILTDLQHRARKD